MFRRTGKEVWRYGLVTLLLLSVLVSCGAPAPTGQPTDLPTGQTPTAPAQQATSVPEGNQAQGAGAGVQASFSYSPALAGDVQVQTVEAVPLTPSVPYWQVHPTYLQFQFVNFDGGEAGQQSLTTPQVIFYRTEYFSSFGEQESSFSGQVQVLSKLLSEQPDLAQYVTARMNAAQSGQNFLPFLPVQNAIEAFVAQPHYVKFQGGSGIAYLTAFAQGPVQVTEAMAMYTFQGLTDDGSTYISAVFPVTTGVFPTEIAALPPQSDPNMYLNLIKSKLAEQVGAVNTQAADKFQPSLDAIDAMLGSIVVTK